MLLKAAAAAALLYWLMSSGRLEWAHLRDIPLTRGTVGLAALGALGIWLGFLLLAWRLSLMVRAAGIVISARSAFELTAIGAFTGAILPGILGGDVVRVVYLCRGEGASRRAAVTAAVICDRALGLASLFLLGTIALGIAWVTGSLPFRSPALLAAPLLALASATAVAAYAARHRLAPAVAARLSRHVPPAIRRGAAVGDLYLRRPRLLAGCLLLSLANHALVCGTFVIAARLLGGVDVSMTQQFLINPLAMAINVIPMTPGGVGLAESAFSWLYEAAGTPLGAAIGILGRGIQYLAFAGAGLPALMLRGRGVDAVARANIGNPDRQDASID